MECTTFKFNQLDLQMWRNSIHWLVSLLYSIEVTCTCTCTGTGTGTCSHDSLVSLLEITGTSQQTHRNSYVLQFIQAEAKICLVMDQKTNEMSFS